MMLVEREWGRAETSWGWRTNKCTIEGHRKHTLKNRCPKIIDVNMRGRENIFVREKRRNLDSLVK